MKAILITLATAGIVAGGLAQAQDALKTGGCLGCHDMEKKKMGPAFKDVAAKHKAADSAALVAKLKDGKGHPKIAKSEAEIKAAVDAALAAK